MNLRKLFCQKLLTSFAGGSDADRLWLDLFGLHASKGRAVVASFDGGAITSDADALLLSAADRAIRLVDRDPSA
jgi:hypothetical protein